ncbi:hypothetical protein E4U46_001352, partial [Claviceps purpurea]
PSANQTHSCPSRGGRGGSTLKRVEAERREILLLETGCDTSKELKFNYPGRALSCGTLMLKLKSSKLRFSETEGVGGLR